MNNEKNIERSNFIKMMWSGEMINGVGAAFYSGRQIETHAGWAFAMDINTPVYDSDTFHSMRFTPNLEIDDERLWISNVRKSTIQSMPPNEVGMIKPSDSLGFCLNQMIKEMRGFQDNGPESAKLGGEMLGMLTYRMGLIATEEDLSAAEESAPYASYLYSATSHTKSIRTRLFHPDFAGVVTQPDGYLNQKLDSLAPQFDDETDLHGDSVMNASLNYVGLLKSLYNAFQKDLVPFGMADIETLTPHDIKLSELMAQDLMDSRRIYAISADDQRTQNMLTHRGASAPLVSEMHLRLLHAASIDPVVLWSVGTAPHEIGTPKPDGLAILSQNLDHNFYVDQKVAESALSSLISLDGRKADSLTGLWIDGLLRYRIYTQIQEILIEEDVADAYQILGFCGAGRIRLQFVPGSYVGRGNTFNKFMIRCIKSGICTTGKVLAANRREIMALEEVPLYLRAFICNMPSRMMVVERDRHVRFLEERFEDEVLQETVQG